MDSRRNFFYWWIWNLWPSTVNCLVRSSFFFLISVYMLPWVFFLEIRFTRYILSYSDTSFPSSSRMLLERRTTWSRYFVIWVTGLRVS